MEKLPVTVNILDRDYKLTIASDDEASLRKAAKLIDTQARNYGKQYGFRDHQDLVAMVALGQITELIKLEERLKFNDKELIEKLTDINTVLDEYLHPAQNSL